MVIYDDRDDYADGSAKVLRRAERPTDYGDDVMTDGYPDGVRLDT